MNLLSFQCLYDILNLHILPLEVEGRNIIKEGYMIYTILFYIIVPHLPHLTVDWRTYCSAVIFEILVLYLKAWALKADCSGLKTLSFPIVGSDFFSFPPTLSSFPFFLPCGGSVLFKLSN